MKKMLFIYNPRSGKGLIRNNLFEIINIFTSGGYQVTACPTLNPHDCFKLIAETGMQYDTVTVSGGDGTLSEAVHGLMELPEKIPLGYIPAGSTNDFASSMSIPKDMEQAARDIIDGVFFEYDVGRFNDSYFVYVAAFGMFTDVPYETSQDVKNLIGHAAYIVEGIRRLPNYRGVEMTVEHDGITEKGNFIVGLVSNSKSVAGMRFPLNDSVFFDDGLFEVSLVRTPLNPLMLQQTLNDAITNRLNTKNFLTFKTSKVTFTTDEPLSWTLDGEAGGSHTKMEITNLRRAIKLVIKPNDNTDQQNVIDLMNEQLPQALPDTEQTEQEP